MSGRPRHDDAALLEAIGPRRPAGLSREERVELLGRAARALLEGRLPDPSSRLFVAGAIVSWLESGGDLVRDYWRIAAPRGSRSTPSVLWNAAHRDERRGEDDLLASSPGGERGRPETDDDDDPDPEGAVGR